MRSKLQLVAWVLLAMSQVNGCGSKPSGSALLDAKGAESAAGAPGELGSYSVFEQDYQFPAEVNTHILDDRVTELWARIFVPQVNGAVADGQHPVLVFLHGNHGTCGTGSNPRLDNNADYTTTGSCPDNYVVTPNHRGYDYLARNLASWGYVVISINANRGITSGAGSLGDAGLNLARGRLVLSHLELLSQWNSQGGSAAATGVELQGHLDFANVGLMGHSRGGEGVRAAYAQYNDFGSAWPGIIGPMTVRGIFEIAPVDGQTSRTLDALNTAWNVLIPLCDGDVSNFQGVKPFDRMLAKTQEASKNLKSTFIVWGANHNFFNTEWQTSDQQSGCEDQTPIFALDQSGSATQRTIGLAAVSAFFRTHVGVKKAGDFASYFDPAVALPSALTTLTPLGRDFILTPDATETLRLFDASATAAPAAEPIATGNVIASVQDLPYHESRRGVFLDWAAAGAANTVSLNFARPTDLSDMDSLDLTLMSRLPGYGLDFSLRLLAGASESVSVPLSSALQLTGASGRNLLQSTRLALGGFTGIPLKAVTGVKLIFDRSPNGAIVLGSIRASDVDVAIGPLPKRGGEPMPVVLEPAPPAALPPATGGGFVGVGQVTDAALGQAAAAHGPDGQPQVATIALTVQSSARFPIRDELPVLHVGNRAYNVSSYGSSRLDSLVFQIPALEFKTFSSGEKVTVSYGSLATSTYVIDAGSLAAEVLSGVQ